MIRPLSRARRLLPLFAAGALAVTAGVGCQPDPAPIDGKAATTTAALSVEQNLHNAGLALGFTTADGSTLNGATSAASDVMVPSGSAASTSGSGGSGGSSGSGGSTGSGTGGT